MDNREQWSTRPATEPSKTAVRATPDFAVIYREKQSGKHVTLQLLWQEYREGNPDGYRYSRFCELYHRWRNTQSVVLPQERKPGEKTFVDWAGATIAECGPVGAIIDGLDDAGFAANEEKVFAGTGRDD